MSERDATAVRVDVTHALLEVEVLGGLEHDRRERLVDFDHAHIVHREPTAVLGVIVGGVVISMYLPLFSLIGKLSSMH